MSDRPPINEEALLAHHSFIQELARRLVTDPNVAADVAQNAYLEALAKPPGVGGNIRNWLALVVRNCARQFYRAETRRGRRERAAAVPEALPSNSELADQLSAQRSTIDAVHALAEPYQSVVMLRYFRELPPREIARLKGIPVATVNSQLARALKQLRNRLDVEHGGNRRAWSAALALTLPRSAQSPTSLLALSVLTMKSKALLVTGIAALVGLVALVQFEDTTVNGASPSGIHPKPDDLAAKTSTSTPPATGEARENLPSGKPTTPLAKPTQPPTKLFKGRVIDVRGRALGEVRIVWADHRDTATKSDASGEFELTVPERDGRLLVEQPNLTTVLAARVGPRVGTQDHPPIVVAAKSLRLRGIVVDVDSAPIVGVRLRVTLGDEFYRRIPAVLDFSHFVEPSTRTDERGRFDLDGVGVVPEARLTFSKDGYVDRVTRLPADSPTDVRIVLRRVVAKPGNLQGEVIDAHGAPVTGARIGVGRAATISDEAGGFVLPMAEAYGQTRVRVAKRGYQVVTQELKWVEPSLSPTSDTNTAAKPSLEFVLIQLTEETRELSGVVVDVEGRPIHNARVFVANPTVFGVMDNGITTVEGYLSGGMTWAEMRKRLAKERPEVKPDDVRGDYSTALWAFVTTDRAGRFTHGGLMDRNYRLGVVIPSSLARIEAGPFTPGSSGVRITVPGEATTKIAGQITSLDGTPLPNIEVHASAWPILVNYKDSRMNVSTGCRLKGPVTVTDAEGRFAFANLGSRVQLKIKGESILTNTIGNFAEGLTPSIAGPLDSMTIPVSRRMRVRIELADPSRADAFSARSAADEKRLLHVFSANMIGSRTKSKIVEGKSSTVSVSEDVATIVLWKDRKEVGRLPVFLKAGQVNVIR